MKNHDINDVLVILISAGWAKRDIITALMDLSKLTPYELEDALSEISYRLGEIRRYTGIKENYSRSLISNSFKKTTSEDQYTDLYLKVRDMLVHDLGLSNEQIVSLLSDRLGRGAHLPPLSKKSLANWLDRLSVYYAPSEILHAAAVIREKYSKGQPLDWGVRGEN